jgi:hypothetical protein
VHRIPAKGAALSILKERRLLRARDDALKAALNEQYHSLHAASPQSNAAMTAPLNEKFRAMEAYQWSGVFCQEIAP